MAVSVICICIHKSKTLKDFYYLGAKCWNLVPSNLREIDDVKAFSKTYKSRLLEAILQDDHYVSNNSHDYFYALAEVNTDK